MTILSLSINVKVKMWSKMMSSEGARPKEYAHHTLSCNIQEMVQCTDTDRQINIPKTIHP